MKKKVFFRSKPNIRKNDTIMALAGKDKGKTGKVLIVFPRRQSAIVEGINFVKKCVRKSQRDQQGGIIQTESPIRISKIAIYCKNCSRPTRIGIAVQSDGTKTRFCKKCKELI